MSLHSSRVELHSTTNVSAAVSCAATRKVQPVHLALDSRLTALTGIWITVASTRTATNFSGSTYCATLVLFEDVNLPDSSCFEETSSLLCADWLEEATNLTIRFWCTVFTWIFFRIGVFAGRAWRIELVNLLAMMTTLLCQMFRKWEWPKINRD